MKKKYLIEWANGQVVSIAVDGERYDFLGQIPDPTDRAEVQSRIAKARQRNKNKKSSPTNSINEMDNVSKYIAMGFLAISILMLGIMAFAIQYELRKQAREKHAPGLVVMVLAGEGADGELVYVPSVEFALPNGNRQMFQISETDAPDRYQKNQAVSVVYDPKNPVMYGSIREGSIDGSYLELLGSWASASSFRLWSYSGLHAPQLDPVGPSLGESPDRR